jgi:hypothetical protein
MFQALREKSVTFAVGGSCSAYDRAEGLCLFSSGAKTNESQSSHINS